MTTKTYTLRNDFHGTTVQIRAEEIDGHIELSPSQARRARAKLCGMADCTCSGPLGTRGRQEIAIRYITPDGAVVAEARSPTERA